MTEKQDGGPSENNEPISSEPTRKQTGAVLLLSQMQANDWKPFAVKADTLHGIRVFKDLHKTRRLVGKLIKRMVASVPSHLQHYIFSYDSFYKGQPLSSNFPLTQQTYYDKELFPYFVKRLPDKTKPTYHQQCLDFNLNPDENDSFVLLSTFGRTGKDSFVFEPYFKDTFSTDTILRFMKQYDLAVPDICLLFDLSVSSMNKIKRGAATGKLVLRKMELILNTPEALRYCFFKNRQWINPKKLGPLENYLGAIHSKRENPEIFN